MNTERTPYPSDVTDAEWALAAPYLTLMAEDAPQREYGLREVLNALRWLVKTGGQWRMMPHDFPPWPAVYQQARRWVAAGCFEAMTHDLREAARVAAGRAASPTAAILDGRTIQSTPESGGRGGYDGAKRRKGSKVHAAVDAAPPSHHAALEEEASVLADMIIEATTGSASRASKTMRTNSSLKSRGPRNSRPSRP